MIEAVLLLIAGLAVSVVAGSGAVYFSFNRVISLLLAGVAIAGLCVFVGSSVATIGLMAVK